jgi:hypothetical protein
VYVGLFVFGESEWAGGFNSINIKTLGIIPQQYIHPVLGDYIAKPTIINPICCKFMQVFAEI